jgi:protein subunit release factor B
VKREALYQHRAITSISCIHGVLIRLQYISPMLARAVRAARFDVRPVTLLLRVGVSAAQFGPNAYQQRPSSPHLSCLCTEPLPPKLTLPRHIVHVTHSRSSGSGGQNVNKVSTKVTLRVALDTAAPFLPPDVLGRLREHQRHRITKGDELVLQCDEERTQSHNLRRALARLQAMVDEAALIPKERVVSLEPPAAVKEARRREKRRHADKKKARRRSFDD